MSAPLHVVVLAGTTTAPEQLFKSSLGDRSPAAVFSDAAGREVHVSLVCSGTPSGGREISMKRKIQPENPPLTDRLISALRLDFLDRVLRRTSLGRLLISLGPTDPSRVVWRAVRADGEAMRLLSSADIVLAADLAAVRAAWHLAQRGAVPYSYFGLQAAEKILSAKFGANVSR